MPYVPVVTPVDEDKLYESEPFPAPSTLQIDKAELTNQIMSLPIAAGMFHVGQLLNHAHKIGRFLSPEQIKEEYPNVSFPKGEYESVVRETSYQKAKEEFNEEVLSNMKPTFWNYLNKIGAWTAGNILSPTGTVFGGIANSVLGRVGGALVRRIGTTKPFTSMLMRTLHGGAEGGFIAAPYAAAIALHRKDLQEPHAALAAIETFGLGVGLGGALRTVFGIKPVFSKNADEAAIHTAINQIKNKKHVDIEPIVKIGLRDAQQSDPISLNTVQQTVPIIQDEINKSSSRRLRLLDEFKDRAKEFKGTEKNAFLHSANFDNFKEFKDSVLEKIEKEDPLFEGLKEKSLDKIFGTMKEERKQLIREDKLKDELSEIHNDMQNYMSLKRNKPKAPTPQSLKDSVNRINSWRGEETTNENDYERQEREKEDLEERHTPTEDLDKAIADHEAIIKEGLKSDDFSEGEKKEVQSALDRLDTIDENTTTVHDALKKSVNSLLSCFVRERGK